MYTMFCNKIKKYVQRIKALNSTVLFNLNDMYITNYIKDVLDERLILT